jgi:hypothetical protein
MARWKVWLRCLGEAVWGQVPKAIVGLLPLGERIFEAAEDFRQRLRQAQPPADRAAALVELTTVSPAEVQTEAQAIAAEVAPQQSPADQEKLAQYLQLVPLVTRQSLRRPEDPSGTTVPPLLALEEARDLTPFIPSAPPRFQVGDTPPSLHGWVLVKRLGAGGFGEVWQVRHPKANNVFAAVKFCLDDKARRVLAHEKHVIDQVMSLGTLPTIVPLVDFDLDADPPYLKYQYIPGGDLLECATHFYGMKATGAIRDLAETVGRFHRLEPPVVHRDLKPSNILVEKEVLPGGGTRLNLRVADFGIGGTALALDQDRMGTVPSAALPTALLGSHTALYASNQQKQGARPDPRDDVFALGVLWYQLLIGDLTSERPLGKWRRKVAALGMSEALIDLLESCCAYDDPDERPGDAAELAEKIAAAGPLLEAEVTNSLGMQLVLVPPGTFWMGGGSGVPGDRQVIQLAGVEILPAVSTVSRTPGGRSPDRPMAVRGTRRQYEASSSGWGICTAASRIPRSRTSASAPRLLLALLGGVLTVCGVFSSLRLLGQPEEVGRGEPFRVELDGGQPLPRPRLLPFAEGVQVLHPRLHEPEEADPLVLAALVEAQQNKVMAQSLLRDVALGVLTVASEGLDGVLGVVVVPRHAVMHDEREELLLVLHQPLPQCLRCLGLEGLLRQPLEEPFHVAGVLHQVPPLQPMFVYGRDD